MWAFRKCQRAKAFDQFFDAAHAHYYEARTIPGLVLLRKWTSEMPVLPGLYTGSFRAIKPEDYDEIWLIVRGLKSMPKNPLGRSQSSCNFAFCSGCSISDKNLGA